jgi:hypothetical protein
LYKSIIANYEDMLILVAINLVNVSLSFYETAKAGTQINKEREKKKK